MKTAIKDVWVIEKGVWGADGPYILYFGTKEEAWEYYNKSEYVDRPVHKRIKEEFANEKIEYTKFFLCNGFCLYYETDNDRLHE